MTRLGEWLEEQRMTQDEFAQQIGAHQTQVSRYATGERIPSKRIRKVIEDATSGAVPVESWEKPPRRTRRRDPQPA